MAILKVKKMGTDASVWINTAQIAYWEDWSGCAAVSFAGHPETTVYLDITPDELAAAIDPDGCPEPGNCGYHQYLGARRDGETSDLTHAGYHAAHTAAERHGENCTKWNGERVCTICLENERRLRV